MYKTEKRNSQRDGANNRLVLHVRFGCGSLSTTIPVSLLANEYVRSVLHGEVSLAAVNIHKAMNGCKNLKIHERLASKMLIYADGSCVIIPSGV